MKKYCGKVLKISGVYDDDFYTVTKNNYLWQDWMFENETITEENKEVEQLNKNAMETKEMTQEEVFAYLKDTKILCTSKEETKKVQEKLFALGFSYYGEKNKEVVGYAFTLYINIHKKMQFGTDLSMWVEDGSRRVEPNEILAIKLKEEPKPKFDPRTLQDFDKVLVRDSEEDIWRCSLFSHIREDCVYKFYCSSNCWKFCVPYNEETKHLKGTTEEAPEFYQVWE